MSSIGAGLILRTPHGRALILKRACDAGDHPNKWCWPGGSIDQGESPEDAAFRECKEEVGKEFPSRPKAQLVDDSGGFHTFVVDIPEEFNPVLNHEHSGYEWASLSELTDMAHDGHPNLHPGVSRTLRDKMAKQASTTKDADIFAPERLSENMRVTPEGFLVCSNVPMARTGEMLYAAHELPVIQSKYGVIHVHRTKDVLFHKDTISSFVGKPLTNEHPSENVDPENWKDNIIGFVQNAYPGEGEDDNKLMGDFVVLDKAAIQEIQSGKRQVSCGYDADYDQKEPGTATQEKIVGNHVALVSRGRAGPTCAIRDEAMTMAKVTVMDRIRAAFYSRDAAALEEELKTVDGAAASSVDDDTHIHVHVGSTATQDGGNTKPLSFEARLDRMEVALGRIVSVFDAKTRTTDEAKCEDEPTKDEDDKDDKDEFTKDEDEDPYFDVDDEDEDEDEDKDEDEDDKDKEVSTKDARSPFLAEFRDTVALAEILAPGVKLPTLDARATKQDLQRNVFFLRRRALKKALTSDSVGPFIKSITGGDIRSMKPEAVAVAFKSAAELAKRTTKDSYKVAGGSKQKIAAVRVSDEIANINKRNQEFWARKA